MKEIMLFSMFLFSVSVVLAQEVAIYNNSGESISYTYIQMNGVNITTSAKVYKLADDILGMKIEGGGSVGEIAADNSFKLINFAAGETVVFTFADLADGQSAEIMGDGNHMLMKYKVSGDEKNPKNFARLNYHTSDKTTFSIFEVYGFFPVAMCVDHGAGAFSGCPDIHPLSASTNY